MRLIKRIKKINAKSSIKDSLDERIALLEEKLASLEDYGQRAYALAA